MEALPLREPSHNRIICPCLVFVAEAAAALLPTASGCWLWEVEVGVLLRRAGTVAGQARQEADLEVVQGRCVTETRLLCTITDIRYDFRRHTELFFNHSFFFFFFKQKLTFLRRAKADADLLARERVRAAEVEYPAPAFSEPHWGAAGERAARPVRETAAARGRPDEEMMRTLLKVAWRVAGVQQTQA